MAFKRGGGGPDFNQLRGELAKGEYRPVYLLVGEDAHRMRGVVDFLKRKVLGEAGAAFNFHNLDGEEIDVGAVVQQALSYPMMCSHQVISVKRAGLLVSDAEAEAGLVKYLEKPAAETILILMSDKVDGRKKWVKTCKSSGFMFDFSPPRGGDLVGWVLRAARDKDLELGQDLAELLVELVGDDLTALDGELSKLSLLSAEADEPLDESQLLQVILAQRPVDPFELVKLLGPGQSVAGLRIFHEFLAEGRSPYELAPLLIWRVKQVAQVADLMREGLGERQIPGILGASPYAVKQAVETARRWGDTGVGRALGACARCESDMKSSPLGAEQIIERAILEICAR